MDDSADGRLGPRRPSNDSIRHSAHAWGTQSDLSQMSLQLQIERVIVGKETPNSII